MRLIPILILFLIFLISIYFLFRNSQQQEKYSGICAFDLDHTLTCGLNQAAKAIEACRQNNCKIAIVTARPTMWYSDLDLNKLGLKENEFLDDFYYGENYQCSFTDLSCLESEISSTKVNHLRSLVDKYQIPADRIILFDDQYPNVKAATDAGFKAVHANHDLCGLPLNIDEIINNIFRSSH